MTYNVLSWTLNPALSTIPIVTVIVFCSGRKTFIARHVVFALAEKEG